MTSKLLRAALLATSVALSTAAAAEELFNGKDLSGWTAAFADESKKLEDVWSVVDGVLVCKGKPIGVIRTAKEYENYVLTLEWRFPEGSKGGNSGVLLHCSTPNFMKPWPKSIEAQLNAGDAGDIWRIGEKLDVEDTEKRTKGRRTVKFGPSNEKPIGQWNVYEITCRGDEVELKVNGKLMNRGTKCSATKGAIALQAEGPEIHFRNIQIKPLP